MEIITADWETFYSAEYSLTKLTMEQYIRGPQFEAIMLGLRMPDGTHRVITGTHSEIKYELQSIDWSQYAVLCHHTHFDAAIFSWIFSVKPKVWLDTLSMGRAMFGNRGNSLKALAEHYNLPEKGTEVLNAMGKRRADFTPEQFARYAEYCINDCEITYQLFELMSMGWYDIPALDKREPFPLKELKLIDATIRMFTEPRLVLNQQKLATHLAEVQKRKADILEGAGVSKADLMSNERFATMLQARGVVPPRKISPTTGKETWAFAKTDEPMKALLEDPNPEVQAIVAARLGVKSTLEETRTQRFIDIAPRGKFPVPLRYAAALTLRWSGSDSINMQNLPARGQNGGKIKHCIEAPEGHVIIDSDSSNIEARGLAWLAEQDDLVDDFIRKVDVYCKMASGIYGRPITKADVTERFLGKTVILGAGYQTGGAKLQATLKAAKVDMSLDECKRIIETYRNTYYKIPMLWRQADVALQAIHDNNEMWLGRPGVLHVQGRRGIRLPSGLYIKYPQLHKVVDESTGRHQWKYKGDKGITGIYGGKCVENVTQALARIVIGEQLLLIKKRLPVVMTVHDAIASVARVEHREAAVAYVEECMRYVPEWATGWPLDCESGYGKTYGDC